MYSQVLKQAILTLRSDWDPREHLILWIMLDYVTHLSYWLLRINGLGCDQYIIASFYIHLYHFPGAPGCNIPHAMWVFFNSTGLWLSSSAKSGLTINLDVRASLEKPEFNSLTKVLDCWSIVNSAMLAMLFTYRAGLHVSKLHALLMYLIVCISDFKRQQRRAYLKHKTSTTLGCM